MITLIICIILGGLIGFCIAFCEHKSIKQQKRLNEILQIEENHKKREYCEYFINQIKSTNSLNTLLSIHKLAWALELKNNNLGPNKFGMFRTNDIIKMTSQEVYLGGIDGLVIRTLADWSNNPKEEYQIVLNQYREHLISNLNVIKLCN